MESLCSTFLRTGRMRETVKTTHAKVITYTKEEELLVDRDVHLFHIRSPLTLSGHQYHKLYNGKSGLLQNFKR